MDQIEHYARRFQAAVKCWASTIASMEQHLVTQKGEEDTERRQRLATLRGRLVEEPELEVLFEVAQELNADLERYHVALASADDNFTEVRGLLGIVGALVIDLTAQSGKRGDRLQRLAKQLELTSGLTSIAEMRRRLLAQVGEMKSCITDMHKESQQAIAELQDELTAIKARLAIVEDMASVDVLTGIANRREGERLLEKRIHSQRRFSVLLFDLDRFKEINDRYGHKWGDRVLVTFARRLAEQIRAGDRVFRWGGDEFMFIFDCGLEEASACADRIAEKVQGNYDVGFNGQALKLAVRASYGVVEHHPGEASEQLFARVDASMYQHKRPREEQPPLNGAAGEASPPMIVLRNRLVS